jgi:putative membrane protein
MSGLATRLADFFRGGLIGAAEVVPGVSGGTIALITGVYDTLIGSAATVIRAVVGSIRADGRRDRWREVARIPWWRLVTIVAGMGLAIVVAARVLEPLIEDYPEHTRAVFLGLILASIAIPLRMAGGRVSLGAVAIVVVSAAVTFVLTGLPPTSWESPSVFVVALAAAVAVCALVLPGVSGSFLLLSIGLYQPTIEAVNNRDLGYLGVFMAGAVVGLGSFVVVLQWLLGRHHRVTLLVMAGLMVGSTRALWPWQTEERVLLIPSDNWPVLAGLVIVGIAVVTLLVRWERSVGRVTT